MAADLRRAMRAMVRRHALFGSGDRVIVGLSGGADSVALSLLLPEVAREAGAEVVALAHLNHRLRPEAEADEAFCREFAGQRGLPFETARVDVRALARERRTSIEAAGRIARYAFFEQVAARYAPGGGRVRIAVAHTRNDQAETVLLRLFRGAGPVGLAAILPRAGSVIRPLLTVRRADIETFLLAAGVAWREDATNRDLTLRRNRIRHELLPYLARHFGDGIVDVLVRQATIAREDGDWLERAATETAHSLVKEDVGRVTMEVSALQRLPPALGRRVIRGVLARAAGRRFVAFDHVEAVWRLAEGRPAEGWPGEADLPRGGSVEGADADRADGAAAAAERAGSVEGPKRIEPETIDLPGQRVKRIKGRLVFTPRPPDPGRAGRRRGRPRPAGTRIHGEAAGTGSATVPGGAVPTGQDPCTVTEGMTRKGG